MRGVGCVVLAWGLGLVLGDEGVGSRVLGFGFGVRGLEFTICVLVFMGGEPYMETYLM